MPLTVVAANAMPTQQGHKPARKVVFNRDPRPLKINNHASKSITNDISDVIGCLDFDTKYQISVVAGDMVQLRVFPVGTTAEIRTYYNPFLLNRKILMTINKILSP